MPQTTRPLADLLLDPPHEYSVMPFWFWNDELDEREILRQIADMESHGVHGFVIHPRVGLPRSIGWMSEPMLRFMHVAIDEARRRGMKVILYDEGMYPSGSSSGQVVARDSSLACRCLAAQKADAPLPEGANVVGSFTRNGEQWHAIDRRVNSYIRGLHYIDEGPKEDEPPAGDILNPKTTAVVIELIYAKFAEHFKADFGKTILGIFTDEPSPLGKCRERNVRPGTTGILPELQRLTGHDFSGDLASLFFDDRPGAKAVRDRYTHAVRLRLNETWYAPLSAWCEANGLWLMGHPDAGDEIGVQRYFQAPGQDLVWRFVEPDKPSAIETAESTQAKCSSSAMIHYGRSRNSNEMGGAYGHQTTFAEIQWLADWCLVRGVNLLIPHAFYYSIRGHRKDERPPQIGPHTPQWDDGTFKRFADHCRRISFLNATCEHVCDLAILTHDDRCPWPAAKVCLEHQRDFNYLDPTLLLEDATKVDASSITVGPMRYAMLVIDGDAPLSEPVRRKLEPLIAAGHVVRYGKGGSGDAIPAAADPAALLAGIRHVCPDDVTLDKPAPGLRVRHLRQGGSHVYLLFNERPEPIETTLTLAAGASGQWMTPATGERSPLAPAARVTLRPYELRIALLG